jgi:hypothetical protein
VAGLRFGGVDFLRPTVNLMKTVAEVEGVIMEDAPVKSKASLRSVSGPVELSTCPPNICVPRGAYRQVIWSFRLPRASRCESGTFATGFGNRR